MRNWSILFCALEITFCCVFGSVNTNAASLQRLPDGRIMLSIYGEHLYFREKDAGNIEIWGMPQYFWHSKNRPGGPACHGFNPTLKDWLTNPVLGHCLQVAFTRMEARDPEIQTREFNLRITPTWEDGHVYPGGIASDHFPPQHSTMSYWYAEIHLYGRDQTFLEHTCDYKSEGSEDKLGFLQHPDTSHKRDWDKFSVYTLSSKRRAEHADRPACIICSYGYYADASCILRLLPAGAPRVYMDGIWQAPDDRLHRLIKSDPNWISYDDSYRKMADSIFVDHPKGYLQ